ncbi:MAG: hypothetical protein CL916_11750, partial [Deltaproteobacteria bacterium]|nr:hypothetical protein [Deltaproteobacteria bacterium]
DCVQIITAAQEYAHQNGGWTQDRHQEAATTDLPFDLIGGSRKSIFQKWKRRLSTKILTPLLFRDYNAKFISFEDLFVVRYTPHTQSELKTHRDGTVISFVLQLNDNYTGGGTYIQSIDTTLNHIQGDICIHSGWFFHGAKPVEQGDRYVLVGFCNIRAQWYTQRKLLPNAPFESDPSVLRKAVRPEFRHKS